MRHYGDNKGVFALSHSASMYVKFPNSNIECRIRDWTGMLLTGKLQTLVMVEIVVRTALLAYQEPFKTAH